MAGTHQSQYFKWKGENEQGWTNRASEHPARRTLTTVSSGTGVQTVDVARAEGTVSTPGDAFSAENMNDLEERIDEAMGQMESVFQDGVSAMYDACVARGVTPTARTPEAIASAIRSMYSPSAYSSYGTQRYSEGRTQGQADKKSVTICTVALESDGYTLTVGGKSKKYYKSGGGFGTDSVLGKVSYTGGVTDVTQW